MEVNLPISSFVKDVLDVPKNDIKNVLDVPKNDIKDVPKDDVKDVLDIPKKTTKKSLSDKKEKVKRPLPLDIIIQLSENNIINKDYIKNQLQTFISKKEFTTVFGVKKTSEIMKGLTDNKWNKSLVIFVSFLYDTSFIYLNSEVAYNSDKCLTKSIQI